MAERTCPQYIEEHDYCARPEGHDGDCALPSEVELDRLRTAIAKAVEQVENMPTQGQSGVVAKLDVQSILSDLSRAATPEDRTP